MDIERISKNESEVVTKRSSVKDMMKSASKFEQKKLNKTLEGTNLNEFHTAKQEGNTLKDYIARIKYRLLSIEKNLNAVLHDHIIIGEINNTEYELISLADWMELIRERCNGEFSEGELKDIEELFAQSGNSGYILVENLYELFGETLPQHNSASANSAHESEMLRSDYNASEIEKSEKKVETPSNEDAHNSLKNLDYTSVQILKQLSNYLRVNKTNLCDLFKDEMYSEALSDQGTINVIKSQGFFAILRKMGALPYPEHTKPLDIHKNLEDFLAINKLNYPFILFIKDLEQVLKVVEESFMDDQRAEENKTPKKSKKIVETDLQSNTAFAKLRKSLIMKDNEEMVRPIEGSTATTLGHLPPITRQKSIMDDDLLEEMKNVYSEAIAEQKELEASQRILLGCR
eukprot:TRINITY_DN12909_c0_g4_i1.p1 TRINITY_DN12909_c0_g4~~TRINITY_DN12909_c0_g4_i1.p1  ORF type:complete len:403 (+),score=89.20 TRINITY_DN12909_c0_g4_i1:789-1997(+)